MPDERIVADTDSEEQLRAELTRLRLIAAAAEHLVEHVGEPNRCSAPECRAPIYWIVHRNGKRAPYNPDGTNHFITCPAVEKFRRR